MHRDFDRRQNSLRNRHSDPKRFILEASLSIHRFTNFLKGLFNKISRSILSLSGGPIFHYYNKYTKVPKYKEKRFVWLTVVTARVTVFRPMARQHRQHVMAD